MRILWMLPTAVAAAVLFAAIGGASPSGNPALTNVPTANAKAAGYDPSSKLSPELQQIVWAQGSTPVENPQGIVTNYGYENDVPSADSSQVPQMLPVPPNATAEAQKTEPDKNTYLVLPPHTQHGPTAGYDYGNHFLYQGHEAGAPDANGHAQGYITRINLDADADHRVTLLASKDDEGNPIAPIDGSTWDPWAQRLLFTTENASAPTYAATLDYPSTVSDVSGALGRGGYEGIQNDSAGDIWIVEDIGGAIKTGSTNAKMPNSFIYRYVPAKPGDLHNGKLQVLQVLNAAHQPITFASESTFPSADQTALHTYGNVFETQWVTIHDTAIDGTASFNANTLAKAKGGTPFKRPENAQFRPGYGFSQFYFDETGDTNATSSENGNPVTGADGVGGWGGLFKLVQSSPTSDTGKLSLFYKGNESVTGLDNVAFLSENELAAVEDAGDTLHTQRNALDSGFVFDLNVDYSNPQNQPLRWLAQGRDASATLDSANDGYGKNEGDNEITGIHVSNGDSSVNGILGAQVPTLFTRSTSWRWFYTQQHGDNPTYEVIWSPRTSG